MLPSVRALLDFLTTEFAALCRTEAELMAAAA